MLFLVFLCEVFSPQRASSESTEHNLPLEWIPQEAGKVVDEIIKLMTRMDKGESVEVNQQDKYLVLEQKSDDSGELEAKWETSPTTTGTVRDALVKSNYEVVLAVVSSGVEGGRHSTGSSVCLCRVPQERPSWSTLLLPVEKERKGCCCTADPSRLRPTSRPEIVVASVTLRTLP